MKIAYVAPAWIVAIVVCSAALPAAEGASDWTDVPERIAPIEAPFPMPQLARPVFPNRTFNVRDYGALGDGKTKNTQAIARTIAACAKAGGGTVLVPEGDWLTGAVHLKSNVKLHLAEGALLRFSTDPRDYLPVVFTRWAGFECYNYSPLVYARDCENIAITGRGKIDGQGKPWWGWFKKQHETAQHIYKTQVLKGVPPEQRIYGTPESAMRPQLISPIHCKNVLLEGITIAGPGPFWTIHFIHCENVIARDLKILTRGGPNTDGLNLDSCRNALVEYCRFDTGDDVVALKSGLNEDGWRVGRPTENVVVRHIHATSGHGGLAIGSEMSGGVRNVLVHDCHYRGTTCGLRIKTNRGRGGFVENIWARDITMENIHGDAIRINTDYKAWMPATGGKPPVVRNIDYRNITCRGTKAAGSIVGLPDQPVENIRLENITISAKRGLSITEAKGLELCAVKIDAQRGPPIKIKNCRGVVRDE